MEDRLMEDKIKEDRLKRQMAFSLEIDKEKNIFRQTHLSGKGRSENDAEHAWHMAIMAYLLREHANEPVDIAKVILMCLIHDIVEIDAGDTYAYDAEGLKTQKAREDAAKERIRRHATPTPSTTSSRSCSTTATMDATGGRTA